MNGKSRVEYGKFDDLRKIKIDEEKTEMEGVKNYILKSVYMPVLDRKHIDKFNPQITCISICGNSEFGLENEEEFIKKVIKQVEKVKDYYLNNPHGRNEHIGEYNLFQNIDVVDGFILEQYTFGINSVGEYYLILWFAPFYHTNRKRRHVYWHGKNHGEEWY